MENPTAIVCSACNGDPRLSHTCTACHGAGVGVPSPDGFLVWSEQVDDFSIAFRKARRYVHTIFHFTLFACTILSLAAFGWHVSSLEDLSALLSSAFWFSGHWTLTLVWLGLLNGCFVFFRLAEYTNETKALPHYAALPRGAQPSAGVAAHRVDIEPFFSPEARNVIEDAYEITKRIARVEVTPNALFASALASSVGGTFLVRLGMTFEKVKQPMARILSQDPAGAPPISLSRDTKRTLALAYADADAQLRKTVTPIEILLQSFKDSPRIQEAFDRLGYPPEHVVRVAEWIRLQERLREDHGRFTLLARQKPKSSMNRAMTAQQTPILDRFSEDLTALARDGYIAPLVGREREMSELLRAIESGNRSVVLVGEHGAGKLALVEQLARRMVEEDVPPELFDRRLVSVNLAQVIAAGDPGLAAERLLALLQDVARSGNVVLAVQGVDALSGIGSGWPMDLAEMFASELDKGYFIAIGTTTPRAWIEHLERRTLGVKLVKVDVPETDVDATLLVLLSRIGGIEYAQNVYFSFAALDKAARLADRYIHDVAAPEKAMDVCREAAVLARTLRGEKTVVTAEDVAQIVQKKTHIPVEAVTQVEDLARAGFDPLFGARPLRRVIQERVDNGLADLLLQGKVGRTDTIVFEAGGTLRVEKAPRV